MDRATTEIKTESHTFQAKTYATALEAHAIQQALFTGTKMGMAGTEAKIEQFNTAAGFEQEQELIRQLVVSMDGSDEEILQRCLQLPSGEFNDLTARLDELVSKKNT